MLLWTIKQNVKAIDLRLQKEEEDGGIGMS